MLPDTESLFERFDGFARSMREFLEALDSSTPEDDRVQTSWARCSTTFDALGDPQRLLEGLEGEVLEQAEDRLDELLRLNAVLTAAVRRERDGLVGQLDRTQGAKRALSGYGTEAATGESCDLSG